MNTNQAVALDAAVRALLKSQDPGPLEIIGAGEMTCVVAWDGYACKRLPPASDPARIEAYGALVLRYVEVLRAADVPVVETGFVAVPGSDGETVGYVVQPRLDPIDLLPGVMRSLDAAAAVEILRTIEGHVDRTLAAGAGIDPQISNWAMQNGEPVLLDVTTPMLRDEEGRDLLDTDLFLKTLPFGIRQLVRRFMVDELLDKNFERHGIFLDLIGNLINYDLEDLTEPFLDVINPGLDLPITAREVTGYRRSEWLTWKLMRLALHGEQLWRTRVLRAPDLHLLPSRFQG